MNVEEKIKIMERCAAGPNPDFSTEYIVARFKAMCEAIEGEEKVVAPVPDPDASLCLEIQAAVEGLFDEVQYMTGPYAQLPDDRVFPQTYVIPVEKGIDEWVALVRGLIADMEYRPCGSKPTLPAVEEKVLFWRITPKTHDRRQEVYARFGIHLAR